MEYSSYSMIIIMLTFSIFLKVMRYILLINIHKTNKNRRFLYLQTTVLHIYSHNPR